MLRRAGWIAAALAIVALLLLLSGHWILGVIVGALAVIAIWAFLQMRTVR